jgi:hypothetical protein
MADEEESFEKKAEELNSLVNQIEKQQLEYNSDVGDIPIDQSMDDNLEPDSIDGDFSNVKIEKEDKEYISNDESKSNLDSGIINLIKKPFIKKKSLLEKKYEKNDTFYEKKHPKNLGNDYNDELVKKDSGIKPLPFIDYGPSFFQKYKKQILTGTALSIIATGIFVPSYYFLTKNEEPMESEIISLEKNNKSSNLTEVIDKKKIDLPVVNVEKKKPIVKLEDQLEKPKIDVKDIKSKVEEYVKKPETLKKSETINKPEIKTEPVVKKDGKYLVEIKSLESQILNLENDNIGYKTFINNDAKMRGDAIIMLGYNLKKDQQKISDIKLKITNLANQYKNNITSFNINRYNLNKDLITYLFSFKNQGQNQKMELTSRERMKLKVYKAINKIKTDEEAFEKGANVPFIAEMKDKSQVIQVTQIYSVSGYMNNGKLDYEKTGELEQSLNKNSEIDTSSFYNKLDQLVIDEKQLKNDYLKDKEPLETNLQILNNEFEEKQNKIKDEKIKVKNQYQVIIQDNNVKIDELERKIENLPSKYKN